MIKSAAWAAIYPALLASRGVSIKTKPGHSGDLGRSLEHEVVQYAREEWEKYGERINSAGGGAAYIGHSILAKAESTEKELAYLISHLPEVARLPETLLKEILEIVIVCPYYLLDRGGICGKLALDLPEPLLNQAVMDVLGIRDEVRSEMLAGFVLRLVDLPPLAVYDIWRKALHFMAGQTREEFLSNIRLLIVLVFELAGERPVYETVGSIHEVGRWWP